ncbi:unnamed protein product, partial [Rotaria sp. Silwood1]
MNYLTFIFKYLLSNNIQSVHVINLNYDIDKEKQVLNGDLAIYLFQSDSQIKHITINDCTLYINNDDIGICTRLTHVSVVLEGMHPIKIRSQECIVQEPPNTKGIKSCSTFHSITFTGWIKYFDHMDMFFANFGSTIESLFLNIDLMFLTVDVVHISIQFFTLPYKFDRFKHLSNEFISSCISNRPVSLCFERVHSRSLITTTPLTLEIFQFIEKVFP